jgi:hypothetical protein
MITSISGKWGAFIFRAEEMQGWVGAKNSQTGTQNWQVILGGKRM